MVSRSQYTLFPPQKINDAPKVGDYLRDIRIDLTFINHQTLHHRIENLSLNLFRIDQPFGTTTRTFHKEEGKNQYYFIVKSSYRISITGDSIKNQFNKEEIQLPCYLQFKINVDRKATASIDEIIPSSQSFGIDVMSQMSSDTYVELIRDYLDSMQDLIQDHIDEVVNREVIAIY